MTNNEIGNPVASGPREKQHGDISRTRRLAITLLIDGHASSKRRGGDLGWAA